MLTVGTDVLRDFERATALEWIETNGLGGWSSSSVCFANTRRYHGMLVTASRSRAERTVVVAKLDETAAGLELGCNRFPGAVHPRGFEALAGFARAAFPVWEYAVPGGRLRKTVVCPNGENTTIVRYELLDARSPIELRLRPFLAGRDSHWLLHRHDGPPPAVQIAVPGARFETAPDWYDRFEYDRERERGLDFQEDLYTPGVYVTTLVPGAALDVVLTAEARPRGSIDAERARREAFAADPLLLAADQFLIDRDRDGRGVIAGYHWFAEWGRDSMIALPGLCLATRRFGDAKRILRRWLGAMRDGRIPNRFVEHGEPEYNSIDAGLWLFIALWKYLKATGDHAFVRSEALPRMLQSIAALQRDVDGDLLRSRAQETWMDARVDGVAITPREGNAVEVNALWYNALRIAAALADDAGLLQHADRTRAAFRERFWNAAAGCCLDVVDPDDASVRPNQLLAISLPFALLRGERAESVLRVCESKLLTPVGLRTLDPSDPRYRGRIEGDPRQRDSAYHQGTVWPWLLGPYISAALRVRGAAARAQAVELMVNIRLHLGQAAVGTISEVFDGDAPHVPRGCIAQAWSVGEVLRVIEEELHGREEDGTDQRLAHR
ncbi:MAG TPA: amylo-alpha-1,6-glucosidase [Thermoanaerobaculia bacterium]|nr:amylo-alpha-1,6-glucosidase [Thermoanaerobaculia bacterium]